MAARSRKFGLDVRERCTAATVFEKRLDEIVDVVLAFLIGGQHAGLEGQHRVFCLPVVFHGVRLTFSACLVTSGIFMW